MCVWGGWFGGCGSVGGWVDVCVVGVGLAGCVCVWVVVCEWACVYVCVQ